MGSRLLCCMVLCLLGAAPLDTAVSQTPKYLIAQTGNKKVLKCEQKLGHDAMYWYKQDSQKLLKVMFIYNNKQLILNETVPRRFLPESSDKSRLNLHVDSLETSDSAVYLCASSQDTALQSHFFPVHKPRAARKLTRLTPFTPLEAPAGVSSLVRGRQYTQRGGLTVSLTQANRILLSSGSNKLIEVLRAS